jgi:ribosomal protein S18 acetylase RimI-like enzyme
MRLEADVIIRPAKRGDLKEACAIDYEAFSPYGTAEMPSVIESRWTVFPQGFVVAKARGRIVGYGSSEKWLTEHEPAMNEDPFKSHFPEGRVFCITAVAVYREWRANGIGPAIVDNLIQIAGNEQCRAILLETTHAQNYYLHRGFHIVGEREQMNAKLTVLALDLEYKP